MLAGRRVTSVRTLTSFASAKSNAGPETRSNADLCTDDILSEIKDWATSLGPNSIGVLHWIGHGVSFGSHGGPLHGLYLPDLAGQREQLLDWNNVERGLKNLKNAPTIWCFVDACRTEPETMKSCSNVTLFSMGRLNEGKSNVNAIYSTLFGGTSYCCTRVNPALDDLEEGPVFSNALLLALDRFAATLRNDWDGVAAHAADIGEATQQRMIQWLTNRNVFDWRETVRREMDPIIEMKPGKDHRVPIVSSPTPHSMLSIKMNRRISAKDTCTITDKRSRNGSSHGHSHTKAPNGWNADLPRLSPDSSAYGVHIQRDPTYFSKGKIENREVFLLYPAHSIVVDD